MPSVPNILPPRIENPGATSSVRADPNMMDGVARANQHIAGAVQGAAQQGMTFVQRKQDLVNTGILSNEETERMKAASGIEQQIAATPNDPSSWSKLRDAGWKKYGDERAERQKQQAWTPRVANEDSQRFAHYRAQIDGHLDVQTTKAQVATANSQIEANAQAKLRSGDYEGFTAEMGKMNIFPDQKEEAIRRGLDQGLYKKAQSELDAIDNLPPADQVQALAKYNATLNEKDEASGKYKAYEFEKGGLSLGGRTNLASIADARVREAQRKMAVNGRGLVSELRMNRATIADLAVMLHNGDIDVPTAQAIAPEISYSLAEGDKKLANEARIEQERKDAEAKRILNESRTQDNKAESLKGDVGGSGGTGTLDAQGIDRRIALGEITRDQGDVLKAQLAQASAAEQVVEGGTYASISKALKSAYASSIFEIGAKGGQPSDATYQKLTQQIKDAKLTKDSRMKLMTNLFDLKLADVNDLQEEGPTGRWADRDISANERQMRKDLITHYKSLLGSLSVDNAGDLLLNQEAKIRSAFDSAPAGLPPGEVEKLKKQLTEEANATAGRESLSKAFDY